MIVLDRLFSRYNLKNLVEKIENFNINDLSMENIPNHYQPLITNSIRNNSEERLTAAKLIDLIQVFRLNKL
jgi:hypothetical protein